MQINIPSLFYNIVISIPLVLAVSGLGVIIVLFFKRSKNITIYIFRIIACIILFAGLVELSYEAVGFNVFRKKAFIRSIQSKLNAFHDRTNNYPEKISEIMLLKFDKTKSVKYRRINSYDFEAVIICRNIILGNVTLIAHPRRIYTISNNKIIDEEGVLPEKMFSEDRGTP